MTNLRDLKEEFAKIVKRVLKKKISKNPITLLRYEKDLIHAYNNILGYIDDCADELNDKQKTDIKLILKELRQKFVACIGNLGVSIKLDKNLLALVTEENITHRPYPTEPLSSTSESGTAIFEISDDSDSSDEYHESENQIVKDINDSLQLLQHTLKEEEDDNITDNNDNNTTNTNMDAATVISLISKILPNNFSGNPLELNAFLNSIALIRTVVADNQPAIVLGYVKSKLTGKALEAIPADANTLTIITNALKEKIKPENSKVISGKMMALRSDNKNKTEFAKIAEDLAEAFQRASIVEGIPETKSREMAIDETVKMCRNNAKTDLVKGILAASKFDSPAEVIAKYMVESSTEQQEKQILAYRASQNRNNRGNNNGSFNNRNNNNRNRRGNNNNFNNGYYQGNNNNYNRNNNNGRYNSNNNRGRGGYRGNNRGNYRNNNNNSYYRGNNDNNYDNNNRNIRYAENWDGPQRMTMGGENNANNNNRNNPNNNNNQ